MKYLIIILLLINTSCVTHKNHFKQCLEFCDYRGGMVRYDKGIDQCICKDGTSVIGDLK